MYAIRSYYEIATAAVVPEAGPAARRLLAARRELLGRAEAAVRRAPVQQLAGIARVPGHAVGLEGRPLVDVEPQPPEPVEDRVRHLLARAGAVGVLHPEDEGFV